MSMPSTWTLVQVFDVEGVRYTGADDEPSSPAATLDYSVNVNRPRPPVPVDHTGLYYYSVTTADVPNTSPA